MPYFVSQSNNLIASLVNVLAGNSDLLIILETANSNQSKNKNLHLIFKRKTKELKSNIKILKH
jgi:hypothetical protein